MRIGIVTDIHDAVAPLARALALLREQGADQIVTMGDAFDSLGEGDAAPVIARMLHEAGAIGVWGNHDVGLTHDVTDEIRRKADPALLAFTSGLQGRLIHAGVHFSHMEPWKDPRNVAELWAFDGIPRTTEKLKRSFDVVAERLFFMGHFHTWHVHREDGARTWDLRSPFRLEAPHRYAVIIGAVDNGWCALYDTDREELTAIPCNVEGGRPLRWPDPTD